MHFGNGELLFGEAIVSIFTPPVGKSRFKSSLLRKIVRVTTFTRCYKSRYGDCEEFPETSGFGNCEPGGTCTDKSIGWQAALGKVFGKATARRSLRHGS